MSPRGARPWPPLVGVERVPALVRARDIVLTLLAWGVLVWLLSDSIALAWDWLRAPMFTLTDVAPPDWARLGAELRPFALFSAALVGWLVFWALVRRRRIRAMPPSPQPPALPAAEEAGALGLDAADLAQCRTWRSVVVEFDEAGRPRAARRGTI